MRSHILGFLVGAAIATAGQALLAGLGMDPTLSKALAYGAGFIVYRQATAYFAAKQKMTDKTNSEEVKGGATTPSSNVQARTTAHVFVEGSHELQPGLVRALSKTVEGSGNVPDSSLFCYRVDPWRDDMRQYAEDLIRKAGRFPTNSSENHAVFFGEGVGEGNIDGLHFCVIALVSGFEIKTVC